MTVRRADDNTYTLATNASSTATGVNSGNGVPIRGGEYCFTAEGTVSGATISLQFQTPNGTWSDVSVFNASAVKSTALPYVQTQVDLPAGLVRMASTGGTPSALYAYLIGLG